MLQLLAPVFGLFGSWLDGKKAQTEAKQKMRVAEIENKTRLLADKESYNSAWEMANLTDKDKWLRRSTFIILNIPFIVAIFSPECVANYFNHALNSMPDWYIKMYVGVIGAIWGLASLKNVVPSFIDLLKKKK